MMSIDADLIAGVRSSCHWCGQAFPQSKVKYVPDDLPDDCYYQSDWCHSTCPTCFEEFVHEARQELALKHGDG